MFFSHCVVLQAEISEIEVKALSDAFRIVGVVQKWDERRM